MDSKIIIDSTAFYAGLPFRSLERYYTTPQINDELQKIPFFSTRIETLINSNRLQIVEPSSKAVEHIMKNSLNIENKPSVFISNERNGSESDKLSIEDILGHNGLLNNSWDWFEPRDCQLAFAQKSFDAFINKEILVAEAGTGLGKSFSYLSAGLIALIISCLLSISSIL